MILFEFSLKHSSANLRWFLMCSCANIEPSATDVVVKQAKLGMKPQSSVAPTIKNAQAILNPVSTSHDSHTGSIKASWSCKLSYHHYISAETEPMHGGSVVMVVFLGLNFLLDYELVLSTEPSDFHAMWLVDCWATLFTTDLHRSISLVCSWASTDVPAITDVRK